MKNRFAGEGSPVKYLVCCREIDFGPFENRTPIIVFLNFRGKTLNFGRESALLFPVVGHMDEFDHFVGALKKLKHMEEEA